MNGMIYFGLQAVRRGVSRSMIHEAASLLDAPQDVLIQHIEQRLRSVHGAGPKPWEWLANQPLIERSELAPVFDSLMAQKKIRRVEVRRTSGSTGTPFRFVKDIAMTAWMDAVMWATLGWWGIRPGDRHARFWGAPINRWARLKRSALDYILSRRRLSAFNADRANCVHFFHRLRRFRPVYAYGYPTLMMQFADYCRSQGLDGRDLRMRVVISTGELLSDQVRQSLAEFFGCRVVNEYGCTESGVLAFECEYGTLHTTPVATYPEVITPDGRPAPDGEVGEVVITDLYGAVMPLRRYRLHDRAARISGFACGCGRSLPVLQVNQGRRDNFIVTPSRGLIYDAILAYSMPTGIQRFRAFQRAVDILELRIVPAAGADPSSVVAECRKRLAEQLGSDMTIEVVVVDEIPYATSGKLQYFVPLNDRAHRQGEEYEMSSELDPRT